MVSSKQKLWEYLENEINPIYEKFMDKIEVILYFEEDFFEIIYQNRKYYLFVEEKEKQYYIVLKKEGNVILTIPYQQANSFIEIIQMIME